MSRYLNKLSKTEKEYDKKIRDHLDKAKKEILSALSIVSNNKKTNLLFRVASRKTESELRGLLTLIERVSMVKPLPMEENKLSVKELRAQRRNRGKVKSNGVDNVRRNRR